MLITGIIFILVVFHMEARLSVYIVRRCHSLQMQTRREVESLGLRHPKVGRAKKAAICTNCRQSYRGNESASERQPKTNASMVVSVDVLKLVKSTIAVLRPENRW